MTTTAQPRATRTFEEDLNYSMPHVTEALKALNFECEITHSVEKESSTSTTAKLLDAYGGCDWLGLRDGVLYGIASRIQRTPKGSIPFDSFTIRIERSTGTETEYQKRKDAIRQHGIYPALMLHAYYSEDDELLSAAIISTKDCFEIIDIYDGSRDVGQRIAHTSADKSKWEKFKYVNWDFVEQLIKSGKSKAFLKVKRFYETSNN